MADHPNTGKVAVNESRAATDPPHPQSGGPAAPARHPSALTPPRTNAPPNNGAGADSRPTQQTQPARPAKTAQSAQPAQPIQPAEPHSASDGHSCEFCASIEAQLDASPSRSDVELKNRARRSRRKIVLLAGGAAAIAAAALVAILVVRSANDKAASNAISPRVEPTQSTSSSVPTQPSSSSAPTASAPSTVAPVPVSAQLQATLDWAGQQLPQDAQILTDPRTQIALATKGFDDVSGPATGGSNSPTFSFVFDTPALRATSPVNIAIARARSTSVPVAIFGSGAQQIIVRQATADSVAVVMARQSADQQTRRSAEAELLKNPALQVSTSTRPTLLAGQLDLRAATVLAYLANSSHLDLIAVNAVAAEQAAGLPIRSIELTTDNMAGMQTVLSGLPILYQPASSVQLSNGVIRLIWPIAAEPLPSLK